MTAKIPFTTIPADIQGAPTVNDSLRRYHAEFSLNDIAPQRHSVFQIDQSSLRPPSSQSSHWSIAWSDLMMTMFILFLSLFVYQAAHKDFLISDKGAIIGGEIVPAMEVAKKNEASLPFPVIKPATPFIASEKLPKVESITLQPVDLESTFSKEDAEKAFEQLSKNINQAASEKKLALSYPTDREESEETLQNLTAQADTTDLQEIADRSMETLFDQSERTIDLNNLGEFASIQLTPNKAVRIVLTGDLLFETGHAALSPDAVASLQKIAEAISGSTHQIHIEGHTDNVPILSGRYTNNWELSMARANAVATFLIQDMEMDPSQFVISGYASYKPVAPNSNEDNMAKNRRVEIVVTKPPQQTTLAQLQSPSSDIQAL
jgi:chemotaxis protein MotB